MIPGEYFLRTEDIIANAGRPSVKLKVTNTGDRPVQVGSHFHFFEVNKEMRFDRAAAFGLRLDIPAGTAVRFEPGEQKEIQLVALGGKRMVTGFSNLANGDLSAQNKEAAVKNANDKGFKNQPS